MIEAGAVLALVSAACLVLAAPPSSRVASRLALLVPRRNAGSSRAVPTVDLAQSGVGLTPRAFFAARVGAAAILGAAGIALGGPVAACGLAYVGAIAPSILVERRARERRRAADTSLGLVVERVEALVLSGRPPETAFTAVAARPTGAMLLDRALQAAVASFMLGAPFFAALSVAARENGVPGLAALADELDRSRDLGRGSLAILRDARDAARAEERTRSLAAAAQVEGRLMLVMVLCYMPALMLAVVVPLFLGLLEGLAG